MKKFENFSNCLNVLKKADFRQAADNEIYRIGIIAQFNLTFELSWKAIQEVLRLHGIDGSAVGSPREILQLAYKVGFISDSDAWLQMLKQRNLSVHVYDEESANELVSLIRERFISAFDALETTLKTKIEFGEDML